MGHSNMFATGLLTLGNDELDEDESTDNSVLNHGDSYD
jgi:hypothetical protein